MQKLTVAVALFCVAGITACVIGPKQDDPLTEKQTADSGTGSLDAADFTNEDTATSPASAADGATDAATDTVIVDAFGDAISEACPDGGVPLRAVGPWNDERKCWAGTITYECAPGLDGGAAFTCFARTSTGELFLASTTQVPTGEGYRACTEAERARVKTTPDLCAE